MRVSRAWIESHIPHQGSMCLLDEVLHWNEERLSCASGRHRAADHPLRAHGRLGIACGIEYAAQTMAVHGALIAQTAQARPAAGLLASVRGVRLHVLRLDDIDSDLICDAARIAGDQSSALYEFELRSLTHRLLSGRATVVFDAGRMLGA